MSCECYHPCRFQCCIECRTCPECKRKWETHAGKALAWIPKDKQEMFYKWMAASAISIR